MPGATQGAKYSLGVPRAAWVSLGPNLFFLMLARSTFIKRSGWVKTSNILINGTSHSLISHTMYLDYNLLGAQCYFFTRVVYQAVQEHCCIIARPSTNTNTMQDNLIVINNSHLLKKYGYWKGLKVSLVDVDTVNSVVQKFREELTQNRWEVNYIYCKVVIQGGQDGATVYAGGRKCG